MDNCLDILENNLSKKIDVLDRINDCNEKLRLALENADPELEVFDGYLDDKEKLINELNKLDEGFELLYKRVADELKNGRDKYSAQIKRMQGLTRTITDKSVSVQAQETQNKVLVENYFVKQRKKIQESRKSVKVAMNYYKLQNYSAQVPPQFMDSKN